MYRLILYLCNLKWKNERKLVMIMMYEQYSQEVSEILSYSREEALRLRNDFIGPAHLLLGIIRAGQGRAVNVLNILSVDLQTMKCELEKELCDQWSPLSVDDELELNEEASRLLRLSVLEARLYRSDKVYTEHVLLAILKGKDNMAAKILEGTGAKVICAFCNISNSHLANIPEEIDCDCLIAGDDNDAKATAAEIIDKIPGIKTIDCGILEKSRIIEKITPLLIGLNIKYKSHYGGLRITGIPALDKD